MSDAALEEKILDGTRNCIAVSGDGTWKTRGHTTLVGVSTLLGAECGKRNTSPFAKKKNHNGSAGQMEVSGMNTIFFRSEHKHGLIYKQYIGDGDTKTYMSLVEKKPYGDSIEIEKIECVGYVQK
ncbi:uncharacterized protein TNCV_3426921 [Trichonephila clavipes]|nr:uncharacterized protein TNCV_3426921 [Trichonephila clavipes]